MLSLNKHRNVAVQYIGMLLGTRDVPKDVDSSSFPGGPPAKYSPGLALLSFGVQMGSSICRAV